MNALTNWRNKGQYFDYKKYSIFTIDEGVGEDILLIHGFPTASMDWSLMWDTLTKKYRVLTLDMIGFGFSSKPRKYNYNIFDQANLVEEFLLSKGVKKIKILSHNYGDTVAQELLARFQYRKKLNQVDLEIESLCFLNGGLFPETHHALLIQKILLSPFGGIVSRLFTRKKLGRSFKKIFGPNTQPTEKDLDEFWTLVSNNNGKYIFHLLIRYIQERRDNRERWVSAIQKATIPIRLINGIFDPISGQHMVDRYKEIIPNHDIIELENIGHFPLVEAPKLVLKHYLEFI